MKANNWLDSFEKKIHSQRGEDGKLQKILEVIGETDKWCVEFGAWDGVYNSSVYNLIKNHGFKAVLIEGSSVKFENLKVNLAQYPIEPINALVGFNETDSLDRILEKTKIPKNFDVLAIDIDGNDYHAWKACTEYKPKVVVIEYNPTIPDEVDFVQEPVPHLNHGAGIRSLVNLGKQKGYELVTTTLNNAFFVDAKYFPKFEIADNSIFHLRTDKSRMTYLFSGYDGTVFVRGFGTLDLHGLPFNEDRMQLLPRFLRGYDDSSAGFGGVKKFVRKTYKSLKKRNLL
jgi:hypothetical protein